MRPLNKKGVGPLLVPIAVIFAALVAVGYFFLGWRVMNLLKENATIVIIILGVITALYLVRLVFPGGK